MSEPPAAQPAPERLDPDTVRPGDPRSATEAPELLRLGYPDSPEREASRERLIQAALAKQWTLRKLGQGIFRERAAAADATHVSALHAPDQRDPVALAAGQDTSAEV